MYSTRTWYGDGLRWIGGLLTRLADAFDRAHETMPRHVSTEEVLSDLRNRAHAGLGAVRPPLY